MRPKKRVVWWKQKKIKPWLTTKQVKRLSFARDSGAPIELGEGAFGNVYVARIHFETPSGPKTHRVAVKVFREAWEIDKKKAKWYQNLINRLKKGRFPIPKMGMYEITKADEKLAAGLLNEDGKPLIRAGQYVQVSQLFGSSKRGTKLSEDYFEFLKYLRRRPKSRKEAVELAVEYANLGLSSPGDSLAAFKKAEAGVIPLDLDFPAWADKKKGFARIAESVVEEIKSISKPHQREELFEIALKNARSELKKALKRKYKLLFVEDDLQED